MRIINIMEPKSGEAGLRNEAPEDAAQLAELAR
jgi:hypothetical protein